MVSENHMHPVGMSCIPWFFDHVSRQPFAMAQSRRALSQDVSFGHASPYLMAEW